MVLINDDNIKLIIDAEM